MSLINVAAPGVSFFHIALYATLVSAQLISVANACTTNCSIIVNFTGNYTDETCNVLINNASGNESVILDKTSIDSLKKNGNEAGSKFFDIALQDCPASRTVTTYFTSGTSAKDANTGNLINDAGTLNSNNVQIRLRKENGTQVIIDDAASGQDYVISSKAESLSHKFTASYYANGDSAVTAGKVHAAAGIVLVYK